MGRPTKRASVLSVWKNGQTNHMRSLATTAAKQIDDGSEEDAASTILALQCAKAKLAAALPSHEQIRQVRRHLNRTEDDIQTKTGLLEDTNKQIRELQTTRKQLTNILHDLREEASDTSDADDEGDDLPEQPTTPRGSPRGRNAMAMPAQRTCRSRIARISCDGT